MRGSLWDTGGWAGLGVQRSEPAREHRSELGESALLTHRMPSVQGGRRLGPS